MKKILGLDIGTTSIGWAIVEAEDKSQNATAETDINNNRIAIHKDAIGVRIIPSDEMHQRFDTGKKLNDTKGNTLTPTATRRKYRGSRRMKSRYKLRRDKLNKVLEVLGMLPDGQFYTNSKGKRGERNDIGKAIYELRDKASREEITLKEWGRILLHLNQWRGYSSDRFSKEEKTTFNYYTGKVIELSNEPIKIDYEDAEKTKIKWLHYFIKLKPDEAIKVEEDILLHEMEGILFVKDKKHIQFKKGDIISFKYTIRKRKDKKTKTETTYYQINYIDPDPTDWNYRYQTFNKNLTEWSNERKTVGSYFFQNFYIHKSIDRIRNNIVNRNWYEKEFEKIWDIQYPIYKSQLEKKSIDNILEVAFKDKNVRSEVKNKSSFEEQLKYLVKEKIIYYQRPWQQAKNKGECRFEKVEKIKERINQKTKQTEKYESYEGRAVIPRSHPLHQEFKIWQQINNVRLWCIHEGRKTELFADAELFKLKTGKEISDVKQLLYQELMKRKNVTWRIFAKETLGLNITLKDLSYLSDSENTENIFNINFSKEGKDGKPLDKSLDGNKTLVELRNILDNVDDNWFKTIAKTGEDHHYKNKTKGKEYNYKTCKHEINNLQLLWETIYDITNPDEKKVKSLIRRHFGFISDSECEALSKVKFDDSGMGNLSAKAIRKLLPLMKDGSEWKKNEAPIATSQRIDSLLRLNNDPDEKQLEPTERLRSLMDMIPDKNARVRLSQFNSINDFKGLNYWEAAAVVYGQHSKSGIHSSKISTHEIDKRIQPVKPHSMNNPVVEKIVNETLSVVKAIYKKYGFDEVRIELSRELKASREEREQMWERMVNNQKRNEWAKMMLRELEEETGGKNIDKIKLYEDIVRQSYPDEYKEKVKEYKLNEPTKADVTKYLAWIDQKMQCPYTGEVISIAGLFSGKFDVDHIIPKERYYDNAYSNKVICRKYVNKDLKGSLLPYELLKTKRPQDDRVKDGNGQYLKDNIGKDIHLKTWEDFQEHVKRIFPKGRKLSNLLRKEIPEDPIARQLKETQYINKKLKEELSKVVGSDKVWTTTGAVTDILRQNWHLDDVMKELVRERYERFEIPLGSGASPVAQTISYSTKRINEKTKEEEDVEIFPGFSKRLDHRHHALDAIIIACTKQQHVDYINELNKQYTANQKADIEVKKKYLALRKMLCEDDKKTAFKAPWSLDAFIPEVKDKMEDIVVTQKNNKLLISPSKNKVTRDGETIDILNRDGSPQQAFSIRGRMHLETNYSKIKLRDYKFFFVEDAKKYLATNPSVDKTEFLKKDNWKFKIEDLPNITKPHIKNIIEQLLAKFNGNLDNVIASFKENSIFIDEEKKIKFSFVPVWKESFATNNPLSKLKGIYDERTIRFMQYHDSFIKMVKRKYKEKEDPYRKKALSSNLYQNAIYEVRILNTNNQVEWVELKKLNTELISKIYYGDRKKTKDRTKKIRSLIQERASKFENDFTKAFEDVFTDGNILKIDSQTLIPIKTIRAFSKTTDGMFEVERKSKNGHNTFVTLANNFMIYVFENKEKEKLWKNLSFFEAFEQKIENKSLKNEKLYPKELSEELSEDGYWQIFTLTHRDMVFISPKIEEAYKEYSQVELKDLFDWEISTSNSKTQVASKQKEVTSNLWYVSQFSETPTGKSLNFTRLNNAKEINIPITDLNTEGFTNEKVKKKYTVILKSIQNQKNMTLTKKEDENDISEENENLNEIKKIPSLEENLIPYNKELFDNCFKVFTGKLGKKVVPYWKFPNGCWDNEKAKELGLL